MPIFVKRYALWIFYAVFLVCAIAFGGREGLFATESDFATVKYLILLVFLGFLAFSLYATRRENFFRSIATMNNLLWGRQVGVDLCISVFLSLTVIYLVEGSALVLLLWFVPVLIFANLAILPYILLNFGEIAGLFAL